MLMLSLRPGTHAVTFMRHNMLRHDIHIPLHGGDGVHICLHGRDGVLVLAENTRIYSHGRLWRGWSFLAWTFLRLMSSHVSMSNPNPESHSTQIWTFLRLMSSHDSMSNPNPESHSRYIISRFHLRSARNFNVRLDVICGFHRTVRRCCLFQSI
jgi:hypothetical protein